MDKLRALFKIKTEEASPSYEAMRISNNQVYLKRILLVFMFLQVFLALVHFIRSGQIYQSEMLFLFVCIFLTAAVIVVLEVGQDAYFRMSVFLTLFLSAIYSWYGSIINYGDEVYLLVLILIGLFIVDAEGFRISSLLSGIIYLYAIISQQSESNLPDGQLLTLLVLLIVLWYYTEHKQKREIKFYNQNEKIKKQRDQLEKEVAFRDILTERLMESEHKFRVFMNHVPTALLVLDQGKITYANKSAIQLTGYKRDELEHMDWIDLLDFEDAVALENKMKKMTGISEDVREYTVRMINKQKKPIWTKLVVTDLKFESRVVRLLSGYDVSSQKQYESQLGKLIRMKEDMLLLTQSILGIDDIGILYDIILDGAIDSVDMADRGSVLILDENGMLHARAFRGYDHDLMDNFSIPLEETFLYLKTDGQIRSTEIINDISRLTDVKYYETQLNEVFPAMSTIATPIYNNGKLYGMVYLDSPIKNAFKEEDYMMVDFLRTQLEMAINKQSLMDEAVFLSRYDKLTSVFNRRWFEEYYQTMEAKASRYGDVFALVMFDLNGVKEINDTYGHLEGDALIRGFALRLKALTRASDILARFGGDEFIGVFHEIDEENLKKRLDGLAIDLLENPIETEERNIYCRFSYGAAYYKADSADYETLVKIADERMYHMKLSQNKTHTVSKA
ncbi:diguanylate cyclase domain-containing protein [Fusibacter sp. JL216-2]|uniref:diguanylate cyclase domain-containing protein n=1 Tax=Fusibacter sp. JL216-2 TaxID=3071453 RepID=UPI003D3305A6